MPELIELEGEIRKETDLAVLFFDGNKEVWLPKSQITVVKDVDGVTVELPTWLAEERELI